MRGAGAWGGPRGEPPVLPPRAARAGGEGARGRRHMCPRNRRNNTDRYLDNLGRGIILVHVTTLFLISKEQEQRDYWKTKFISIDIYFLKSNISCVFTYNLFYMFDIEN